MSSTGTFTYNDGAKQRQPQQQQQNAVSKKSFHFVAGLGSGLLSALLLQPLDLLKTRVQQRQTPPSPVPTAPITSSSSTASITSSNVQNGKIVSPTRSHALVATLREILASPHPVQMLWRGTVPSAVRTGAGSALYFGGLNALRAQLAERGLGTVGQRQSQEHTSDGRVRDGSKSPFTLQAARTATSSTSTVSSSSSLPKLSHTANLLTGAAARAGAGMVMMPVTVLKVRYESSMYNYTSLISASRDILRTEGVRGFFAGFGATAVRDAPYAGLYVLFYELGKKELNHLWGGGGDTTTSQKTTGPKTAATINFTSATLAAILSTSATNPFDAIKTRLQLEPARYRNMVFAAKTMLKEEGVRSLFDGLMLRMSRKALSSALAWTVYEEIIRRAERRFVVS